MCEYLNLKLKSTDFVNDLNSLLSEAHDNFEIENNSAIRIQRLFRGHYVRAWVYFQSLRAIEIQRIYRGFLGKCISQQQFDKKNSAKQKALYNYFAVQLQRAFRAFYSRKYKYDFAKRKLEIKRLIEKGEEIRRQMEKYANEQQQRTLMEEKQRNDAKLQACASNLHHLVSTQHIRGVYNPNTLHLDMPTLSDIPVEDHIRGVVRDLLKAKIQKTVLIKDINGTNKIPLKGLKTRLSLQASSAYDAVEKQMKSERLHDRIIAQLKGNFFAGGRTRYRDSEPISKGDPYVDKWANPMTIRGVPANQKQLTQSCWTRKPLFLSNPTTGKAFYTRTGGNKSTVLANDLFDTILQAEETGGAIQRHLGTTERFGVADNCDYRPPEDDAIPSLPLRPTVLLKTRTKMIHTRLSPFQASFQSNLGQTNKINDDSSDDD